ncbi:unnamed protein product [Diatraea saccharalis]|uniref:Uncharacterized protein n=1 Tax=Diatraea saccharalis TaxID=40085 RepID=A0A9P0C0Y9_9NEOP|nr:unnamed protein product [Diatraea saccharalis]
MKTLLLVLATTVAVGHCVELTNYDISRNRLGTGPSNAGSYGQHYPSGPGYYPGGGYGGQYPGGQYPGGHYPSNPGVVGPPGAHPGCPLCDSSVYSYCSHKQAHDACCCDNPAYLPVSCRKSSCGFLYANSCQEYQLISNCCCVDLYKNNGVPTPLPVAA